MLNDYWVPLLFILGGLILGIIFEGLVLRFLRRTAAETKWGGDDILVDGFRGMPLLWFTLIGINAAIQRMPLTTPIFTFVRNSLVLVAVLSVMIVFERIIMRSIELHARKVGSPSTSIYRVLIRIIVFSVWLIIVFRVFDVSITPLLTALGVGGLAIALALQDTLSNMFSGLYVTASKKIKPGDYLRLESGEEGRVTDITWRDTTIRTRENNMVIVPNSRLAGETFINYTLPKKDLSLKVELGVDYRSDLDKVERITQSVAKDVLKVEGGVIDEDPVVRFTKFGDFSINVLTIMRVKNYADQYAIRHKFIKSLHKRYKREGIVIPFPIRTVKLQRK